MTAVDIRNTSLQIMELKANVDVLAGVTRSERPEVAAKKVEKLIPELAKAFLALDVSDPKQAVLRERLQTEVGILLERRLYYVVQAKLLAQCLHINPNPIRLQEQIIAGIGYLVRGASEKTYIHNALECVAAGGIVDSESGLAGLMDSCLRSPEAHVSYRAIKKSDLLRAAMATQILSGLIQNMVDSSYLVSQGNHDLVVSDALCLMSALGGREGANEAVRWMVQCPDLFKLEGELNRRESSVRTEDRITALAVQALEKSGSTNILSALYEFDVERYHAAFNSPGAAYTTYYAIKRDHEAFDLECIRGAEWPLLKSVSEAVRTRFEQDEELTDKRGKQLLKMLQTNGMSISDFVVSFGDTSPLKNLEQIMATPVPEAFLTQAEALEFMGSLELECNAVLLALLTKQTEIINNLKTSEPAIKLVSALMIHKHGLDVYKMLGVKRDHLTQLELIAYGKAHEWCTAANALRDDFIATWRDQRTMHAIRNFDPEAFNAFRKLYPDIFTEEFVQRSNWLNLHMRKKLFMDDLCI